MCALICLCVPSVRWSCDQEKYKEVYQARLAYHQQEFTKLLDAPGDFDIADHPMMHAFCTEVVDGELEVFGPDDVRSTVALNIAAQQVEMIATKWQLAEAGFDTLTEAAANATELLELRDNLERTDAMRARSHVVCGG